ncbi:methylated-DNA--protein-cysteine methyltransferase [Spirochaetia bacterium]|nr:methylated-DNA--protein-cysteine methyltransferase [Spirochaetia bacterium]
MNENDALTAYQFKSKIGFLGITAQDQYLRSVSFGKLPDSVLRSGVLQGKNKIIEKTIEELTEYLDGKRKVFDIPLKLNGTPFQMKVWESLKSIPYGETRAYKEIAQAIGNEKAVRPAGSAIGKNPIAIIIPCHRVIGSDGSLTGFAGGLDIKQKLLEIENPAKP